MDTLALIIHVLAATLLVGPQLLLFFAVVPATWLIEDERLKRDVTRVVTARFGMVAGISIVALLLTGLYQFYSVVPEHVRTDFAAYRFGTVFVLKMTLFTGLLILIAVHAMVIGRRIRVLNDAVIAGEADPAELDARRRMSFIVSFFMLVVSIGILVLGVMLGHHEYSHTPL